MAFLMVFTTLLNGRVFCIIRASLHTTAVLVIFPIYINGFMVSHSAPTFFQPQCSLPHEAVMTQEIKQMTTKPQSLDTNN